MTGSGHFLDLATSVGDYVTSEAEQTDAGSRWSTIGYFGTSEYSPEVFSGVAGIVLFLADLVPGVRERLLSASASTIDRLLRPVRERAGSRRRLNRRRKMGS